jgi:hypothetical protein
MTERDDERCAEAARFQRIDEAFRRGDIDALRTAVDDPSAIPNGPMPVTIGSCLVYAIYHSPFAFIRALLDLGADPNAPADDGFPPLIAAISKSREAPGTSKRDDVDEVVRMLLARGADPHQRGINDWTPLHMAVAERNMLAAYRLLEGGADPTLRTRIDDCDTPIEMAQAAGLPAFVDLLTTRGRPARRRLRSGVAILVDVPGSGEPVRRQQRYRVRLRTWLNGGEPVRWKDAWGPVGGARLDDEGATLETEIYVNRGRLISGLFYGFDGMRVGGLRVLEIAPHMAYGEAGVPDVIPPNAVLTVEVAVPG